MHQHVSASVHKASSMKAGVEEHRCPAQSPDLNATKHV